MTNRAWAGRLAASTAKLGVAISILATTLGLVCASTGVASGITPIVPKSNWENTEDAAKYVSVVLSSLTEEQKRLFYKSHPGFENKPAKEKAALLEQYARELSARDPTYCNQHPEVKPPCNVI